MEMCIYTWFGFRYPFEKIINIIKEAGFQSVMTWWGDDYMEIDGPKEKKPEVIRNSGLKLENVHFPFSGANTIWEDSQDGHETFNLYKSYINDCGKNNIPTAVLHLTCGDNPPPFGQIGLDRLKSIIEYAEKHNVNIAFENLRKPEYLEFIFKNINSNKLKFCYDSGHENCFTPDMDLLEKYGDKLIALHLHDNNGKGDEHLLPFNGTVNWKRIMAHLKRLDYKGSLAFEIDAQYIDVTNEYTASEYLNELKKRAYKLLNT